MKRFNKYNNKKVTIDGHDFDSIGEGERYRILKLAERAGTISALELQPKYQILPTVRYDGETMRMRVYILDFRYKKGAITVVEDFKSVATSKDPVYRLKKQMFLAKYRNDVQFREVLKYNAII